MGGRGAYYSGRSRDYLTREYDAVGTFEGIKIIEKRDEKNGGKGTLPTHSHTSDVYILQEGDKIRKIGYYENHNLVREIDLDDDTRGPHAHNWETVQGANGFPITRRSSGKEHLELTESESQFVSRLLNHKKG